MDKSRPLILVTNDDGIGAPGLQALIEAVDSLGELLVIAPDRPQSSVGHAITLNNTIRVNKIEDDKRLTYSCSGTPVDCVKFAVTKLLKGKPTLCVSGINHGSNSSINVIYSGTMSAAVEGAVEGVPAIGFSLCDHSIDADFSEAKNYVRKIAEAALHNSIPENTCLNVNIPNSGNEKIAGIRVCRQADAKWVEQFDERTDPAGRKYYWLTGKFIVNENKEDSDEWALANNYVSIVPVSIDLTRHSAIAGLKNWKYNA